VGWGQKPAVGTGYEAAAVDLSAEALDSFAPCIQQLRFVVGFRDNPLATPPALHRVIPNAARFDA